MHVGENEPVGALAISHKAVSKNLGLYIYGIREKNRRYSVSIKPAEMPPRAERRPLTRGERLSSRWLFR